MIDVFLLPSPDTDEYSAPLVSMTIRISTVTEQSTFLLTLNELNSLVYNLTHLDVDSVSMLMYLNYISRPM